MNSLEIAMKGLETCRKEEQIWKSKKGETLMQKESKVQNNKKEEVSMTQEVKDVKTEQKESVTVMDGYQTKTAEISKIAAEQLKALMDQGLDLSKALEKVLPTAVSQVNKAVGRRPVIEDRETWIRSLDNIQELRNAIKVAFAKRSKSQNNPVSYERYTREIKAGQARLNELIADIQTSQDPLKRAIELGERISGVTQYLLEALEKEVEAELTTFAGNLSKKALRTRANEQSHEPNKRILDRLEKLGKEYVDYYQERSKRDIRVQTINRKFNLIDELKKRPIDKDKANSNK